MQGYLNVRAVPEAGTLLLSPRAHTRRTSGASFAESSGPIQTFLTCEPAERELEDVLRDEPSWSEKLRVEPFNFRVEKRYAAWLAGCAGPPTLQAPGWCATPRRGRCSAGACPAGPLRPGNPLVAVARGYRERSRPKRGRAAPGEPPAVMTNEQTVAVAPTPVAMS